MKVKAAKKEKPVDQGLVVLKKTKADIQKVKKPKAVLKQSTAKVVAANGAAAASVKLPEKLVVSKKPAVDKQAKPKKTAAEKKNEQENAPPAELVVAKKPAVDKQAKLKKTAAKKKNEQENAPPAEQNNGEPPVKLAKPAKKQKKAKGVPVVADQNQQDKQPEELEISEEKKAKKAKKALVKAIKNSERRVATKIPKKCTEETLALVPEKLISKQSFQKIYETFRKKGDEKANRLFGDDLKYSMQIVCVKVPRCPSRNNRVALPHPLLRKEDEVCLIVKDPIRGRAVDYTPVLHEWEDKLKKLDIGYKVQVIPFQQLKRDYNSFEMKRKLAQRYERFLVDARISGHVFSFLGSQFIKRSKNPAPVKLENEDKIKEVIENALHVQTFRQGNKGNSLEIKFAVHWMPVEQAVENGMVLLEKLKTIHPGGWLNIQSINITTVTEKSQSLPIYVSTIDPNLVPVPVVVGVRAKFVNKQQKMIKKRTGGKYEVTRDGVLRKARTPNADGATHKEEESDVELADSELEEDDNFLPYDDEPPGQRRHARRRSVRVRGPKMRVK